LQRLKFLRQLQAMTSNIRLPDELGAQLRAQRLSLKLSKSELAAKAGKVREVVSRLEDGRDSTVSSLMAILGALGLTLRLERVGLPAATEVARRFQDDDDAS
jgi:transcriptional regulator with XRE-family HTH domain